MLELGTKLSLTNPGFFTDKELLTTTTSIDSLAAELPDLSRHVERRTPAGSRITTSSAWCPKRPFLARVSEEGDGVVSFKSAHTG